MVGGAGAGFRLHSPHRLSTPLTAQPALMPPAVVHGLKLQLNGMCHLDTWCNLKAVKGLAAGSPPLCPCGEVLQPAPLPITEPQGLLKPESRAPAPSQLMELSHKPIPASRGHRATPPPRLVPPSPPLTALPVCSVPKHEPGWPVRGTRCLLPTACHRPLCPGSGAGWSPSP